MKVVFTEDALADLENTLAYSKEHWPSSVPRFQARLKTTLQRLSMWPESANRVLQRPEVRAVSLRPFPYKLFYQVNAETVTILHVHHTARRDPWER